MIASTGFPGGEATDTGLSVVFATASNPRHPHTTHEASVVSAWLRGECSGERSVRSNEFNELFRSTIALKWPAGKRNSAYYGTVMVVRDAKLDSDIAARAARATLVFVPVPQETGSLSALGALGASASPQVQAQIPTQRDQLRFSVRAGLDAMIVEGVRTAIIAPAYTDEAYISALEEILNTALNEPPLQPLEYVDDSAVTVTHLSRRACFSRVVIPAPLTTARPAFGRFV
jgi:hypothetical protein